MAPLAAAGLLLQVTLGSLDGHAQSWPVVHPAAPPAILQVPYLPQSELLCGGAALAMVERWWGWRGVQAEDFAAMVRPSLGGIRTADLDSAARARGWETVALRSTAAVAQQLLRDQVPVIALLQVGRDRFHYVVVLGWDADEVVFHDPAVSPFTRLTETEFLSQWAGSEHWALIVRPATPGSPGPAADQPPESAPLAPLDSMPCRPWLDRALDAVGANQLDAAGDLLDQAARACPAEPLVRRELAGVRFKQGRHVETIQLTAGYLLAEPRDELAWQLLATSRYLTGDRLGALEAWNRIGRPVVDLVVINGSRSLRYRQLVTALGVPPRTMLTPARVALAQRRLQDVPALQDASVSYRAVAGGVVEVEAAVLERPKLAPPWRLAATGLVNALAEKMVMLEGASLTGAGERWLVEWRWERARRRTALRVDVPITLGTPGVVSLEGAREGMRMAVDAAAPAVVEDTWRSVRLGFGSWLAAWVRPTGSLGLEQWSGERSYVTFSSGSELRARDDRLRLSVSAVHAVALLDHPSWQRGGARAMWASSLGLSRAAWSVRVGGDWASEGTPLGAWPVAGGNLSRAIPLRAEPSPRVDLLAGRAAGQSILHGGLSGDVPVHRVGPLVLAVGAFLDGARVAASADATVQDRNYLDGGVGIRVGVAEGELGLLRIDLARGLLADHRSALTAGMHLTWPIFSRASR